MKLAEPENMERFFVRSAGRDVQFRVFQKHHDGGAESAAVVDVGFPVAVNILQFFEAYLRIVILQHSLQSLEPLALECVFLGIDVS
jgi:hypothetical protein